MADKSVFLEVVGDTPTMRILQYFIEGRDFDYTLTDLADNSGVSWATLYTILPKLLKFGVIKVVRQIGRAKLYKINKENRIARNFIGLYDYLIKTSLTKLEKPIPA